MVVVGKARTTKRRSSNAGVFIQDGQVVAMNKERDELDSANAGARDQEVIAAGISSMDLGEELIIQKGVYTIRAKMDINKSGVQIRGDKPVYYYDPSAPRTHSGTILRLANNLDSVFHVKGIQAGGDWKDFVTFENLSFDGANRAYTATAINADHASGFEVNNCFFNNIAGSAIDICDSYGSLIEKSYFNNCGVLAASKPVVRYSGLDSFDTYAIIEKCIFKKSYYKWIDVDPSAKLDYFLVDGCYFESADSVNAFTGVSLPAEGTIKNSRFAGDVNGYFVAGIMASPNTGNASIKDCWFNGGSTAGTSGGISLIRFRYAQIKGNIFRSFKNPCIYFNSISSSEISGNAFQEDRTAIYFGSSGANSLNNNIHDNIFRLISGQCIYAPGDCTKIHHNIFHTITGYTVQFVGHNGIQVDSNTFDGCSMPLSGWPATTTIRGNSGFKTEIPEGLISPPFAVDAIDTIDLQFNHGLAITPKIHQCHVFAVVDGTSYDWTMTPMVVNSDANCVRVKVRVHEPSENPGATAKIGLVIG